jgi:hypothetical protein
MSHFQSEVDRARCVCQRADGNVIDSGGGDPPDSFQRDAAARFELDVVPPQRESFPNLGRLHVVQKDNVDAVDLDESPRLLQIVGLHFDADVWLFFAKPANLVGKPEKPSESGKVIVLYEDHIEQAGTVINATASDNRGLFQCAEPRGRFACVEYSGRMIANRVNELPGERCDAAKALKKI